MLLLLLSLVSYLSQHVAVTRIDWLSCWWCRLVLEGTCHLKFLTAPSTLALSTSWRLMSTHVHLYCGSWYQDVSQPTVREICIPSCVNSIEHIIEVTLCSADYYWNDWPSLGSQTTSVSNQRPRSAQQHSVSPDGKWLPVKVQWFAAAGE